jgi:hypothetical protein
LAALNPVQAAVMRRSITDAQKQAESRYAKEKIKPTPETVSSTSSTHAMFGEVGVKDPDPKDADMMAGMKHDVVCTSSHHDSEFTANSWQNMVKETFSLKTVPREAYYMGLAGTIPYLATSLTTVLCAWEINNSNAGYGFLLDEKTATQLLHLIEPVQIGYGASILSFLGAIHWGLEWAGYVQSTPYTWSSANALRYGGYQSYKRYAIGVVAPAVAWSTILMPIEGALITQFMGFVALYYVDVRATKMGWTPDWYRTYRFVLTAIVGASIVLTLIGRGELPDHIPGPVERRKVLNEGTDAVSKLSHDEEARAKKEQKKKAAVTDDRAGEKNEDKKR